MNTFEIEKYLLSAEGEAALGAVYRDQAGEEAKRYAALVRRHRALFGERDRIHICSAPGRTEICGNHTDHNNGRVLAAAVNLDTVAAASPNGTQTVTIYSEGYDQPFTVDLQDLSPRPDERETTQALIRGVAARTKELGRPIGGFDACVTSTVFKGSGLSSSAAFEVMLCKVFETLYDQEPLEAKARALLCQYAENVYFGKPCGLLDQMASSVGGLVAMDFEKPEAAVRALSYDFAAKGYAPVVVAAGGDHGNLTGEYAAIPAEMRLVARALGKETLRAVSFEEFEREMPRLTKELPDRAILRAYHFFEEDRRVVSLLEALDRDDIDAFLSGINRSGDSSWRLLQNLYVPGRDNQRMPLALKLSERILQGRGAQRIHGGGFAGTILAFVPLDLLNEYHARMDSVFGDGACVKLSVRPVGPSAI